VVSPVTSGAARSLNIPKVFVSYAHEDQRWVDTIIKALAILTRHSKIKLWSDRHIDIGAEWEQKIFSEIRNSTVVILLLSNDFLNSDFIISRELPAIFAEKERRNLAIIPIVVRPCAFNRHEDLRKFQLFNNPELPLSRLKEWQVETELLKLVDELAN
jgi:hypothetical protein